MGGKYLLSQTTERKKKTYFLFPLSSVNLVQSVSPQRHQSSQSDFCSQLPHIASFYTQYIINIASSLLNNFQPHARHNPGDRRASIIKTALIKEEGAINGVLRGENHCVKWRPFYFPQRLYHVQQYIFNPSRGLGIYK